MKRIKYILLLILAILVIAAVLKYCNITLFDLFSPGSPARSSSGGTRGEDTPEYNTAERTVTYGDYSVAFGPNELSVSTAGEDNHSIRLLCAMLSDAAYSLGGTEASEVYRQMFDGAYADLRFDYDGQVYCSSFAYGNYMVNGSVTGVLFITVKGTEIIVDGQVKLAEAYSDWEGKYSERGGYLVYDEIDRFATNVFNRLVKFIDAHPEMKGYPLKVYLSGHSLGGACANLLAAELTVDARNNYGIWDSFSYKPEICAYTFGAINSVVSDRTFSDGFENIHNVYNSLDTFSPDFWGMIAQGGMKTFFGKFGHVDLFKKEYAPNQENLFGGHLMSTYLYAVCHEGLDVATGLTN